MPGLLACLEVSALRDNVAGIAVPAGLSALLVAFVMRPRKHSRYTTTHYYHVTLEASSAADALKTVILIYA